MKLARQHLRILRKWRGPTYKGEKLFKPFTRRQMTNYQRYMQMAGRFWNTRKSRGFCMNPLHLPFELIEAKGHICKVCGKPSGLYLKGEQ